jgi:hypothetical protein
MLLILLNIKISFSWIFEAIASINGSVILNVCLKMEAFL